jgi:hypothetical protein
LGLGRLAAWRKTVLKEGDGLCDLCWKDKQRCSETVLHLFVECPHWAEARGELWRTAGLSSDAQRTLSNLFSWRDIKHSSVSQRLKAIRIFLAATKRRIFFIIPN